MASSSTSTNSPPHNSCSSCANTQLSVFIAQDPRACSLLAESETHANGFSIESWTQDGLSYAIVSDTNSADVHELGELLKTAAKQ